MIAFPPGDCRNEEHPVLAAILTERRINAANLKIEWDVYKARDEVILDIYRRVEQTLYELGQTK